MPTRPYLEAAKQVAVWIRASAVATPAGPQWPIQVGEPLAAADLDDGSSCILLFFLELYRTTGDETLLDGARQLGRQWGMGNDNPV